LITIGVINFDYMSPFTPKSEWFGISAPIQSKTFSEGTFEGIEVLESNKIELSAFGATTMKPFAGGVASTAFEPGAAIEYPLEPYVNRTLGESFLAIIKSPGELRVNDSQGRVTGLVNGEELEEIPHSQYLDGVVVILSSGDVYRTEVVATQDGAYGLALASVRDGGVTVFRASDIPIVSSAVHQYTVDWDALSPGEEGVTVQIDSDGDGMFEETVTADSELTGSDFILRSATEDGEKESPWLAWIAVGALTAVIAAFVAAHRMIRKRDNRA
jgi:hypothetical protein